MIGCLETQNRRMWTLEQSYRDFMTVLLNGLLLVLF